MIQIGYLGPKATFSHSGAKAITAAGAHISLSPLSSILDLFIALSESRLEGIVVPIENSIEGSVSSTVDLLARSDGLVIQKEVSLPIRHAVLVLPGTAISDVTDIVSHPQVLAQCAQFIQSYFPTGRTHQASSTASAVEVMKSGSIPEMVMDAGKIAVLGGTDLAEEYGLTVLKEDVQDVAQNTTRFIWVGRSPQMRTGDDKTSIVFSTPKNTPGSLVNVLIEFSDRDINLTKIVSRPTKTQLGDYLFFVDFEGHSSDPKVKELLAAIQPKMSYYKFLGSYPKAEVSIC
jgi:prephenate dehydratase